MKSPVNDNAGAQDTSVSAQRNTDLLMKLESLKANNEDSDFLAFYAVMVVMSAVAKLVKPIGMDIKEDKTVEASVLMNQQVQELTDHVEALLKNACPADHPLNKQLIPMAKAAMKVPFEYLRGKGMVTNLSISMDKWRQDISQMEREESQAKLETALRSFIDARIRLE